MATEYGDYFDEILREAESAKTGKPVSGYTEFFSEFDSPLILPQRGDREPSDAELFYDMILLKTNLDQRV